MAWTDKFPWNMTARKATVVAVIVIGLCLSVLLIGTSGAIFGRNATVKSKDFPYGRLLFSSDSFKNDRFVYANCDPTYHSTKKECKVILSIGTLEPTYQCNVILRTENKYRTIMPKMDLYLLGSDKAILLWSVIMENCCPSDSNIMPLQPIIKFTIVKLKTCQVSEAKIDVFDENVHDYLDQMNVIPYEDSFDVMYMNNTRCRERFCRMRIDENGKKLSDEPWIPRYSRMRVKSLGPKVWDEGHLVLTHIYNTSEIMVVRYDETKQLLEQPEDARVVVFSTDNDGITICYDSFFDTLNITCYTYDHWVGQVEYKSNVILDYPKGDGILHHLPNNNGFLLAFPQVDEEGIGRTKVIKLYHVYKFDNGGRFIRELTIEVPPCDYMNGTAMSTLYENDVGMHCLNALCITSNLYDPMISSNESRHDSLSFNVTCFDDNAVRV